jgi:tetratricopeptide (TPR) repeat protein
VISQPIPKILNDRYELGTELGRGGMGAVYRAHDAVLDRDVAVKLLTESGLGTEGRLRMLREAQAIAKLNHPNIVQVHDAGQLDGTPFIIMELVEGQSLHDRPPEGFQGIVAVARQICAALEHAHQHGIIHRDLKPENVLIGPNGNAKLMDFGLARSMASRLTVEGQITGTVFYMAPEIALGQDIDGRADLYSLGVMLYELTTGSLPFGHGDPLAVISQHLHASVVPPKAKVPEIPPPLDALIVQLMSKAPADRPADAAVTRQMLERSDLLDAGAKAEREVLVLDRIVRGRFVGREQELDEARVIWNRVEAGEGQALLISGEPGVGKTRLMHELVTHVEIRGGKTLVGASYAEGGAPYAPFAQIVRGALGGGAENGFEVPEFVLADLLTLAPELKPYYPAVPANPALEPEAEQRRLFENVVTFCTGLSESHPLLIVLDDAHWADSGSLALLRHLARRLRNKRVLLLATYRELEVNEARPLRAVLLDLNRERLARRLKLGRLTRDQTGALLEAIFEEDIAPDFLEGIFRETEGNPFFIEELCKELVESGRLYYQDGRWHRPSMDELELPQSIREVIQARVSKLTPEHLEALTLAAILGREFDFDTLSSASGVNEEQLIEALEIAEQAQLIEEVSGEHGATFSFAHALIPATLAESVPTLRRRKLHRQAAQAIESLRPEAYEDLAHHYEAASDDDRALAAYIRAGKRASGAFANQEAARYFRAGLDLNPGPEDKADLLAELGVVLTRLSNFTEAIQSWERSAQLYSEAGISRRVAWCYARMARAGWFAGDPRRGLELAEAGLATMGDAPDSAEMADLLHETARAYYFNGLGQQGLPLSERALSMARAAGDARIQADILATQGLLLDFDPQQTDAGQAALEQAIALAQTHGLLFQEARARNNLATILGPVRGDPRAARDQVRQAHRLAHQMGDQASELFTGSHAVNYGILLGDLVQVDHELTRLEGLREALIDPGIGDTELRLARRLLEFARGYPEQSVEGLRLLQRSARERGDLQSIWAVSFNLAAALIELSEYTEAEAAAVEAGRGTAPDLGSHASSRVLESISHAKRREVEDARRLLDEAKRLAPVEIFVFHAVDVARAEAQLAVAESRWSEAWTAFEQVVSRYGEMGMRLGRARGLRDWAEGHLARGEAEDIEGARELLSQARAEFESIGSTGYVQTIDARLANLPDLRR